MRPFLMSTAALVFLALPALAQPGSDRDRGHGGPHEQNQAAPQVQQPHGPTNRGHEPGAAPTPQAAAPNSGDRGRMDGRDRGNNRGAVQQAAPIMQPQAAPQNRAERGRNNGQGFAGDRRGMQQVAPVTQLQAPVQNRSDRGRNDLQGNRGTNNFANRPGGQSFGNRPGGASADRGARRDFSSFRDFHRSFNAPQRFHAPDYRRPNGWYGHRWSFGEFLPSLFWAPNYWLNDYYRFGLPPPPYGTVWVRDGYDALLIDRDSGEIITVEYDVFY
jgi:Ni/Co efflux regulator RcnB